MFTRNKPGEFGSGESPRDTGVPLESGASLLNKPPQGRPMSNEPLDKPITPQVSPMKPRTDMTSRIVEARKSPEPMAAPAETKKLIVGRGISLNGKIAACDRLIVEGKVEAELQDCHTIEIAESGTFKGAAEIESAEVSGHYEGSLTVRKNLLIHGTGHVSGNIRYGRLQIEQGGEINGDVKSLSSSAADNRSEQRTSRPASLGSELPLASSNG
jgi:cytoskeletal protein CcmA (bactofilin family)